MRIKRAGIDYSITSPGICIGFDDEVPVFHAFRSAKKQMSHPNLVLYDYPEWITQEERLDKLATWVLQIVQEADVIQMEGYAMAGKGRVFDLAEAAGLVKHFLYKIGKQILIIPPTNAKKFATGSGGAKKNQMVLAYNKENSAIDIFGILGRKFDPLNKKVASPMGDIVDSYWMWKYREQI